MTTKKIIKRVLFYLGVLLVVLFAVFPLYWILVSSVKPVEDLLDYPPSLFPLRFSLESYVKLFRLTDFPNFVLNSCVVCFFTVLITISIAILGAYALTRFRIYGKDIFANLILFVYMVPPVLLIFPLYLIVVRIRLADTLSSLVIVNIAKNLPFSLWLLRAFFQSIPLELEESAFIDGASRFQVMFRIFLPVSFPGIIATSVYTFATTWNDYIFALVFISTSEKKTIPVGLSTFITEWEVLWEYIITGSVIAFVPVVIFFLATERFLIKGWGAGAVKG
jgi:multiple sugar transport system permease protein